MDQLDEPLQALFASHVDTLNRALDAMYPQIHRAVDLLCEIGSEGAVPALEDCLERFPDEAYLRFAVDLAIQRLRGESAL